MKLEGLYAITDEVLTPDNEVVEKVRRAIQSGVKIIQYRNKNKLDIEVQEVCVQLQNVCRELGALFILDDRLELAMQIEADGIHIGKDDISLVEARKKFDGIIGVSCYGDIERAKEAQLNGASYVAFGSFFTSPTKPHAPVVSMDVLRVAKKELTIPICIIGGINQDNINLFAGYDVDMVSVVSAIFKDDAIETNIARLFMQL